MSSWFGVAPGAACALGAALFLLIRWERRRSAYHGNVADQDHLFLLHGGL